MKQFILKEEDFIRTFDERQKGLLNNYMKVKPQIERSLGMTEISRSSGVPINRIGNWMKTKGAVPFSARCLIDARKRRYFSIHAGSKKAEDLAYLVGYSMGDGNISRDLCKAWFYGVSEDLSIMNRMLAQFSVTGKIYTYKIDNGKMAVNDRVFARLMASIGSPVGDKTKSIFGVPDWVINSGNMSGIKGKFLQGLFDSELSTPKLIYKNRTAFQSMSFYSIKEGSFVEGGINYLKQIKNIVSEFGITSTEIKKGRTYIRSRDSSRMVQLHFIVHSNHINLNNFIKRVGFLHNRKRREETERHANFIKKSAMAETEKNRLYELALKKRNAGMSAYQISRELGLPIHHAKNWLYRGCKPRLYKSMRESSTA